MPAVGRFLRRLRNAVWPDSAEAELSRELEAHLSMLEERFRQAGMSAGAAAAAARRELAVDRTRDLHRDARSLVWLEDLRRDLRYAARILSATPGFTALAILTLSLGIGSVTIIYSVIHNVLLDPLPYPASDRFVNVAVRTPSGGTRNVLGGDEFEAYRDQATAFEGVVGTRGEPMLLEASDRTEAVRAVWVTSNFFDFMGLPPLAGRTLTPQDARPDSAPVAVLRHRAWVNFFGADPQVLGRVIVLNGEPRTVVGVMPARFTWHGADFWIPIRDGDGDLDRGGLNFQARLRPDVTISEAEAQLATIAANRAEAQPDEYADDFRIRATYVIDDVVGDFRGVLFSLLAAVGLLMLVACCNVANMLLARATTREREMTVRAALGAGRGRLIRQLLAESALIAGAGAAAGVVLAYGGLRLLIPLLPEGPLPGEIDIAIDRPVLLISLGTAALSGVLFGLTPALFGARADLVEGLKAGGRSYSESRRALRGALVVAEIALAVVLVLSSGLLLRTFLALATQDLGFDPDDIMSLRPAFAPGRYTEASEKERFYRQWLQRIAAVPGVAHVAAASGPPPFGAYRSDVEVFGQRHSDRPTAVLRYCTDDYFETLGVSILRGAAFSEDHTARPRPIAVVNEAFVGAYLAEIEPIGRTIRLQIPHGPRVPPTPLTLEITGVVSDVRNNGIREPTLPEVYLPGIGPGTPAVLVNAPVGAAAVSRAIRHELARIDPQAALREIALTDLLNRNFYAQPRFSLIVLAAFSIAAMLLVAIGVYSVMAFTVSQLRRDIAVRLALGARRTAICGMVLRWAGMLVAAGLAAGLAATFATTRLLEGQLWRTSPHDLPSFIVTVVVVSIVALVACLVPIRRAMAVDPIAALRQD